jgi:hypothetical protein
MCLDSHQEFFANVELMLQQESTAPRNCLMPFFYLHLLCMPRCYWHAPDLLRFPDRWVWEEALADPATLVGLTRRLTQFEMIWPRFHELVLYFQAQGISAFCTNEEEPPDEQGFSRLPLTAVLSLLEQRSFRAFLTDQVRHDVQQDPRLRDHHILSRETLRDAVNWGAPELFMQGLTTLAQHGWIEMLPASPGNDLLIRLKRFPAQPTTETSTLIP